MKNEARPWDWAVLCSTCVACGSVLMVVFMCLLVGFGLNTTVGKEALYVCLVLNIVNVGVIRAREQSLKKTWEFSQRMRSLHLLAAWVWRAGAVLLLFALIMGLCGTAYSAPWVYYPCLFGTIFLPLGWLGILTSFSRRRLGAEKNQRMEKH